MPRTEEKRISCRRCQARKIKCSRTSPCSKCSSAGVRCEYRDFDSKRAPITREYFSALESRVASLELFLSRLKTASVEERNRIIEDDGFIDQLQCGDLMNAPDYKSDELELGDCDAAGSWREDEGCLAYYGPTSVYNAQIMKSGLAKAVSSQDHQPENEIQRRELPRDPLIEKCVDLFFRWQQPSVPVVTEEKFYMEFQSKTSSGSCSPALVYSICSLGALMSGEPEVRQMSDTYAELARTKLSQDHKSTPASIQASLLCATYAAGQGSASKAWNYSGLAFRMDQELGPQPSRTPHITQGKNCGTPRGINDVFARMHLNCYLSDKSPLIYFVDESATKIMLRIMSLFFGRGTTVNESDAQLNLFIQQAQRNDTSSPSTILRKQVELARIIQDVMAFVLDSKHCRAKRWLKTSLTQLNTRLCGWHDSLLGELRWNRWGSCFEEIDLQVAGLHMLYHITRLSLNRHLLHQTSENKTGALDSTSICLLSVDLVVSILHRYRAQYSLKAAPLTFVQATIMATDVLFRLAESGAENGTYVDSPTLSALGSALEELSHSWAIARHARIGLQNSLQDIRLTRPDLEVDQSPAQSSDSGSFGPATTPNEELAILDTFQEGELNFDGLDMDLSIESACPDMARMENFYNGTHDWDQIHLTCDEAISWTKLSSMDAANGGGDFNLPPFINF